MRDGTDVRQRQIALILELPLMVVGDASDVRYSCVEGKLREMKR